MTLTSGDVARSDLVHWVHRLLYHVYQQTDTSYDYFETDIFMITLIPDTDIEIIAFSK